MRRAIEGIFAAALVSMVGMGCQNSVVSERDALYRQNNELQNRNDELARQLASREAQPAATPALPAAAVAPRLPEPAPEPMPVAPAPAPKPDLGDLEVTHDKVAGTTTVNLPSDVFFASGQAVLLPEAKHSLVKLVTALKKEYTGKPIRIEGYTDSDPIRKSHWKSNVELSEKRAEAVRDYLVSKGVSPERFNIEGLGDAKPKSRTDKARNRRVELVVLTG